MIQTWVNVMVSFAVAIALNLIKVDGIVIEKIAFSWDFWHLLALAGMALVISTFCWIIRTNAMKYVSASVVAVMMPFSSVVTGLSSVALGADTLTLNLILGGLIVFVSAILSSTDDIIGDKTQKNVQNKFLYQSDEKFY